jgi:hypothetical protein
VVAQLYDFFFISYNVPLKNARTIDLDDETIERVFLAGNANEFFDVVNLPLM